MLSGGSRFVRGLIVLCTISLVSPRSFGFDYQAANRKLETHLNRIEEEARSRRWLNAGILIGAGALMGLGSTWATESGNKLNFGLLGIAFTAAGVVVFYYPTDFERWPKEYRSYQEANPIQIRNKVVRGEEMLLDLATRARLEKRWGGSILLALGFLEIVFYMTKTRQSDDEYLLYSAPVPLFIGARMLLSDRMETRENADYLAWKRPQLKSELKFQIVPLESGAMAQLHYLF